MGSVFPSPGQEQPVTSQNQVVVSVPGSVWGNTHPYSRRRPLMVDCESRHCLMKGRGDEISLPPLELYFLLRVG